jgi:hypothetical protein
MAAAIFVNMNIAATALNKPMKGAMTVIGSTVTDVPHSANQKCRFVVMVLLRPVSSAMVVT